LSFIPPKKVGKSFTKTEKCKQLVKHLIQQKVISKNDPRLGAIHYTHTYKKYETLKKSIRKLKSQEDKANFQNVNFDLSFQPRKIKALQSMRSENVSLKNTVHKLNTTIQKQKNKLQQIKKKNHVLEKNNTSTPSLTKAERIKDAQTIVRNAVSNNYGPVRYDKHLRELKSTLDERIQQRISFLFVVFLKILDFL